MVDLRIHQDPLKKRIFFPVTTKIQALKAGHFFGQFEVRNQMTHTLKETPNPLA